MATTRSLRRMAITAALAGTTVLLAGGRARALFGVGDTSDAFLAQLIANGVQQLARLSETLEVARRTYDQGRKVVGYAEEGYAAAESFRRFNVRRFGEHLRRDLEVAYPDAMYYRDQVEAGRWSENGQLAAYARHCLDGTLRRGDDGDVQFDGEKLCADIRQELGSSHALAALAATFGSVPEHAVGTESGRQAAVIDAEVAAQLAAHTSQWNRSQRVKQLAAQLEADCAATAGGGGPAGVCEAAAQRAQVDALAEHAETNRLLAEQSRVLALQLEQRNAELKRDLVDARARRTALAEGARTVADERITIRTGSPW